MNELNKNGFGLTFINFDGHGRLVVRSGGEDLGFLGGHNGVPGNEFGHHSSDRLNAQGQRANVQKHQVTCSTHSSQ